jgi:hypothetical protein
MENNCLKNGNASHCINYIIVILSQLWEKGGKQRRLVKQLWWCVSKLFELVIYLLHYKYALCLICPNEFLKLDLIHR